MIFYRYPFSFYRISNGRHHIKPDRSSYSGYFQSEHISDTTNLPWALHYRIQVQKTYNRITAIQFMQQQQIII